MRKRDLKGPVIVARIRQLRLSTPSGGFVDDDVDGIGVAEGE